MKNERAGSRRPGTFFTRAGIPRATLGIGIICAILSAPGRALAGEAEGGAHAADTPNIVLILADDLGWGDLGAYGATKIETPNCDRLAGQGRRYTDAHSPSAVCSPTRYGVLTGRYAWRTWLKNGILLEHMPLLIEPGRLTLASMLEQRGYATACIGKWHLGWGSDIDADWDGDVSPGPLECGFDYFFGLAFSHESSARFRAYVENRRILGLKEEESIGEAKTLLRLSRRIDYTATRLTEIAIEYIEGYRDRPFFLYFPTTNVHRPWTPHPRFQGRSDAGRYGDYVAEFDWIVGEITTTLDRLGIADRTLLIVTSDNGNSPDPRMNGHDPSASWRGNKGDVYEAGHRVPFIVRWPGRVAPGTVADETICLTDILATCAAVVGYAVPDSAAEDSYNLLPSLLGEAGAGTVRGATVVHSTTGMFAIRRGRWKLIEGPGGGGSIDPNVWNLVRMEARFLPRRKPGGARFHDVRYDFRVPDPEPGAPEVQLYDLQADPGETANLYREHPEVVEQLRRELDRIRDSGRSLGAGAR